MTVQEAVAILRAHNEWRRGNRSESWHDPMPFSPADIGAAIDVVCGHIDQQLEAGEITHHARPCWCDECHARFAASKQGGA